MPIMHKIDVHQDFTYLLPLIKGQISVAGVQNAFVPNISVIFALGHVHVPSITRCQVGRVLHIAFDSHSLFPKQCGKVVLFSDFDKQRVREFREIVQTDNGIAFVRGDIAQWCDASQTHIEDRLPDFIIVFIIFWVEIILGKIVLEIPAFPVLLCGERQRGKHEENQHQKVFFKHFFHNNIALKTTTLQR